MHHDVINADTALSTSFFLRFCSFPRKEVEAQKSPTSLQVARLQYPQQHYYLLTAGGTPAAKHHNDSRTTRLGWVQKGTSV